MPIKVLQNKAFTCLSMALMQTFTRKHLCWSLFYKNVIKKRLQQRCFTVNMAKFLRTASFIEIFPRLLFGLKVYDNLISVYLKKLFNYSGYSDAFYRDG